MATLAGKVAIVTGGASELAMRWYKTYWKLGQK